MRRIGRAIFNRWVLGAICLLALALLVWWVGPWISIKNFYPYEAEWVRWLQISIIILSPIARLGWKFLQARRGNAALADGLLRPGGAPLDASAGEVGQLRRRFADALNLLKRRHFGSDKPSLWARIRGLGSRQYLYDLPWYVFIGAPGAGKTTALINSGLRFPLATRLGNEAVRGVGGTRDCDWWFTDEAVFLDTAGRYTTQQSHQELDAGAWRAFLQLLKKARPRRPINGVLVTISVADLLEQTPAEREAHSEAIRSRVRELYEQVGVRLPVYALVSKSDLLAGFNEFFGSLGRDERGQVWGFSLPLGDQRLDPAGLAAQLEQLERRLYEWLPERLEEEREATRRTLLYGFPQQFALLRDRLVDFVERTFSPTTFDTPPLLRGVYFTSGTQEGSPIDRVMASLARQLGLEHRALPAQRPSGRSYFLTRLIREVILPESGLAGLDLRGERRRHAIQIGAAVAAVVVVLGATAVWSVSYLRNREYLAEVAAQLQEVKKEVAAIPEGSRADLASMLPTLGSVRSLSESRATADGTVPWSWRFGLYQGGKLDAATRTAYRRMLQGSFLPSFSSYLEAYLRSERAQSEDGVYEALKTYVMLYDPKHFNRDAVWGWFETQSTGLLAGASPAEQKALRGHFESLYEPGWVDPPAPRDDALIARVRSLVTRDALAKRGYDRLRREATPELRDFTVMDKAGPRAMLVFERTSREPLTRGVAALYTKDGYYKQVVRRLDLIAVKMAEEEGWVLGSGSGPRALAASPGVAEAVKRLYLEDYRRFWRQFINDLGIIKPRDLKSTIDMAQTLSGADTPLRPLVKALDRETTLSVVADGERGILGAVSEKTQQLASKARQTLTGTAGDPLVKALVDDQFEDVHRLAGTAPGSIDTVIQQLGDFYQYLIAAKVALDAAQNPPPADASTKVRAEGGRLPEPFRSMVSGLAESGAGQITERTRLRQIEEVRQAREKQAEDQRLAREKQAEEQRLTREKQAEDQRQSREKQAEEQRLTREKQIEDARVAREKQIEDARVAREKQISDVRQTRDRIDAELRAQVADFCVKAVNGRYPFVRSSAQDVTTEDFSRLFAPGGLLDTFFQKNLAPHVDTTQGAWRFRDHGMAPSAALAEFQRAQIIRDVFFRGGGNSPSLQLEFKPLEMDATISQFVLDVDGKVIRYAHGPQVPVRVQFPGPGGRSQVRVSISPPPTSGASGKRFEGPWALFRMFDEVKIEETNQLERFMAAISVDGRRTVFEILASSVRNPFRLPELGQFHCPTAL
jgi:type VI secretion system protein ImpL